MLAHETDQISPFVSGQVEQTHHFLDLPMLLGIIWERRKLIVAGAFICAALAAAAALYATKFASIGVFQLHAPFFRESKDLVISLPNFVEFKRLTGAVADQSRFEKFLEFRQLGLDERFEKLPRMAADSTRNKEILEPQWALSRADAKELADMGSKEGATQLLGVRIRSTSRNAASAQAQATVLAEYLKDTAFHVTLIDYVRMRETDLRQQMLGSEANLVSIRYNLKTLVDKVRDLKVIGGRYPEAARTTIGQVVGLSDSTVRYLPLPTQLVALETSVADVTQSLEKLQRDRDQMAFQLEYFAELRKIAETSVTGEPIIQAMAEVREKVGRSRDLKEDKFKQTAILLELESVRISDAFYVRSRFISGPTIPQFREARLGAVIPLGLIGGGILMCLLVFLLRWLKENQVKIFSPK